MTPELLGRAFGEAPDPEMARLAVSRMEQRPGARELLSRPDIIPAAARLLGFSTAAADFFTATPGELAHLSELRPRDRPELAAEAREAVAALGLEAGLRRFRRRASYRAAARDLAGAPVDEVMAELTAIAEACLAVALAEVAGDVRMAVIGMGKLGGRELNYSSDVDVLFVHREPGGSHQERAARAVAALLDLLSRPTAEGIALRVDPNLRPEGRAGPLSRSLPSMTEYYERHAATWERQALLKARPVAGEHALGEEFLDAVVPFVYPSILPASSIEDVRASKARIEEHVRALGKERSEVKRGRGGIRDVEFAVQLLQLVHGRRHPEVRSSGTLPALAALAEAGFVAGSDAEALAESYRFLRRLEHRLQMVRDLQTHELPADRRARWPLARAMGLQDPEHLMAEYERHTMTVRGLHERLFYRPLLEAFAGPVTPRAGVDRTGTEELLAALGFADPVRAYSVLAGAVDPATRLGKVLGTLLPVLAPAVAFAQAPDAGLVRFGRVAGSLAEAGEVAERAADLLADRPDAARRLAALVAASSAFADLLAARPRLVLALGELPAPERTLFPAHRAADQDADLVRVAGAHAAGDLRVPETGRRLAAVADATLARALESAGPTLPLAVIGLGTLGAEELSFGSDLDVMFVYQGEGPDDFRVANDAAEQTLRAVVAAGWRAHAELRPEGKSGPLARSMASFLEYWERWAETWEFQALLRARFVAGDEALARRFLSAAADFAYPAVLTFEQVAAIRRMRVRMEEERVKPEARRFHFKLGYGGLADVQFAVELSQMRHGNRHPEVRRTNTLEAVEALAGARVLEDSVARSLAESHVFLTEIKTALEIERRLSVEALPPTPEALAALARRLGFGERSRQRFLEEYRRVTRQARLAMERVFYGDER